MASLKPTKSPDDQTCHNDHAGYLQYNTKAKGGKNT